MEEVFAADQMDMSGALREDCRLRLVGSNDVYCREEMHVLRIYSECVVHARFISHISSCPMS